MAKKSSKKHRGMPKGSVCVTKGDVQRYGKPLPAADQRVLKMFDDAIRAARASGDAIKAAKKATKKGSAPAAVSTKVPTKAEKKAAVKAQAQGDDRDVFTIAMEERKKEARKIARAAKKAGVVVAEMDVFSQAMEERKAGSGPFRATGGLGTPINRSAIAAEGGFRGEVDLTKDQQEKVVEKLVEKFEKFESTGGLGSPHRPGRELTEDEVVDRIAKAAASGAASRG